MNHIGNLLKKSWVFPLVLSIIILVGTYPSHIHQKIVLSTKTHVAQVIRRINLEKLTASTTSVVSKTPLQTLEQLDGLRFIPTSDLVSPTYIDPTFNVGTGTDADIYGAALQSDGKIIIGGFFSSYNGVARNRIARLNTNGTLDTSYNPGALINGQVFAVTLRSDGKLMAAGNFTYAVNGIMKADIARFNTDGSLDTTFVPSTQGLSFATASSSAQTGYVYSVTVQPDNKVVVGGVFSYYDNVSRNNIVRLNTNGTLDTSFNPGVGTGNGNASASTIFTTALQPDGKILIGGKFATYGGVARMKIARINTNGTLDTSFNPGVGVNYNNTNLNLGQVKTILVQPDSKIVIGGYFTAYNNIPRSRIARLYSSGTLDLTFDPGLAVSNNTVVLSQLEGLTRQPDGKIVVSGQFSSYGGISRNNITRINTNGTLDTNFDPGMGTNGRTTQTLVQPDGKIVVVGGFSSYNSVGRNNIVRLIVPPPPTCVITALSVPATAAAGSSTPVSWSTNNCTGLILETNTGMEKHRYSVAANGSMNITAATSNADKTLDVTLIASNTTDIFSQTKTTLLTGVVTPPSNQCAFASLVASPSFVSTAAPSTTISWTTPVGCNAYVTAWTPDASGQPIATSVWKPITSYFNATDSTTQSLSKSTTFSISAQMGSAGPVGNTTVLSVQTVDIQKQ